MGFVGTVASADTQAVPQAAGATVAADSPPPSGDDTGGGLTPEQLAKEAQNPVGNVTVLPFQSNWNYGSGPFARMAYNLNFQPVFPIYLTPRLNLIVRTIFPMISAPSNAPPLVCASAAGCGSTFGIGDTQEQLFFAPRTKPGTLIWGGGSGLHVTDRNPGIARRRQVQHRPRRGRTRHARAVGHRSPHDAAVVRHRAAGAAEPE
jgi:hypothetical protein